MKTNMKHAVKHAWFRIYPKLKPYLPALALIAFSFVWYALYVNNIKGTFHAHRGDMGDYRFLAEKFWGVESNPFTYRHEFRGGWGVILNEIPFRSLGMGTMYLAVAKVVGIFSDQYPLHPRIIPIVGQLFLAFSHLVFYGVLRKRIGTVVASVLLAAMVLPPWTWISTEKFMTESYLHGLLLLAAACLLLTNDIRTRKYWVGVCGAAFFALLASHVKTQWILLGAFLGLSVFAQWCFYRKNRAAFLLFSALIVSIPLSIVAVNYAGWGVAKLTTGTFLHTNRLTDGAMIRQYCYETEEDPWYCDPELRPGTRAAGSWFMNPDHMKLDEILHLDEYAKGYMAARPWFRWQRFKEGMGLVSNFPDYVFGYDAYPDWTYPLTDRINLLVWMILFAGLLHHTTFVYSAFGLAVFSNPAIANMFSRYDARYLAPIGGIPMAMSVCVAMGLALAVRNSGGVMEILAGIRFDRLTRGSLARKWMAFPAYCRMLFSVHSLMAVPLSRSESCESRFDFDAQAHMSTEHAADCQAGTH